MVVNSIGNRFLIVDTDEEFSQINDNCFQCENFNDEVLFEGGEVYSEQGAQYCERPCGMEYICKKEYDLIERNCVNNK